MTRTQFLYSQEDEMEKTRNAFSVRFNCDFQMNSHETIKFIKNIN